MVQIDYYTAHKTFLLALKYFHNDLKKFRTYFKDKRLTKLEKDILKSKIAVRNSKYEEALELLQNKASNPFLNAHQEYQKGIVLNNQTQSKLALKHLQHALSDFEKIGDERMCFDVMYTIAMTYVNLKNIPQIKHFIGMMKKIKPESQFELAALLRCEAHYYALVDRQNMAYKKLNAIAQIRDKKLDSRRAFFVISGFLIYFKFKDYAKCESLINEYKTSKGFVVSANFHFMNTLLNHLLHDGKIYIYPSQMHGSIELSAQMNVIKLLAAGENLEAQKYWQQLEAINPELYGPQFLYQGDYCLFKACLDKYPQDNYKMFHNLKGTAQEKLYYILNHIQSPISKETLIHLIWNEQWSLKNIERMNKLITRTKLRYRIQIKQHKGSIMLQNDMGKKSA